MTKFIIYLTTFLVGFFTYAQEITGDWYGSLSVQGTKLPLVFHVSETEIGFSATMDSPAQSAFGIPATSATFENSVLKIQVANAGIAFEGNLAEDNSIEGKFKQGGMTFPLILTRNKAEAKEIVRPQEPKEPFSYHSEDIIFKNEKDGIELAGTLTMPSKTGKFPAVILVSGSGPQDRDEELMGHKPFLVLADYLTKNGIAVLRFDDRGVGESGGDFSTALTTDFATDAEAALEFLKSKKGIDKNKIGIIGHSEGGIVAPIVAARNKDVDFIVLLAAPGIRGDKLLLAQKEGLERKKGVPEMQITMSKGIMSGLYNIILTSENEGDSLLTEVKEYLDETLGMYTDENQRNQIAEQVTNPWMMGLLKNEPSKILSQVKIPVLAMNGSNDLQVPAKENLERIQQALEIGGNKNVTIKEFENLNHLFQESKTGLPDEYGEIEQTFSPVAMEFMTEWIKKQVE